LEDTMYDAAAETKASIGPKTYEEVVVVAPEIT
jgi:hypothetical protein